MSKIKALAFDVGGSVFDWKTAIIPTIEARISQYDASIDAEAFAMEWRLGMFVTLAKLHGGQIAQCNMDVMLAMSLDILLEKHPDLPLTELRKRTSWPAGTRCRLGRSSQKP